MRLEKKRWRDETRKKSYDKTSRNKMKTWEKNRWDETRRDKKWKLKEIMWNETNLKQDVKRSNKRKDYMRKRWDEMRREKERQDEILKDNNQRWETKTDMRQET